MGNVISFKKVTGRQDEYFCDKFTEIIDEPTDLNELVPYNTWIEQNYVNQGRLLDKGRIH